MASTSRFAFLFGTALAVLALALPASARQTVLCEPPTLGGAFPTSGSGDGTYPTILPTFPLVTTTVVTSAGAPDVLTELKLNGLTHTYIGDVQLVLEDPSGAKFNIFNRPGNGSFSCDYSGNYIIVGPCTGGLALPTACTTTLPAGTYDQSFGNWPSGTNNIDNVALSSIIAIPGTWTLYIYDWVAADVGVLTSWELCWGAAPSLPTPGVPTLTFPANNATVPSPVNLQWTAANCTTSHTVEVDGVLTPVAGTSFLFAGAQGPHSWRVRGENGSGSGAFTALQTFNFPAPPIPCSSLQTIFLRGNGGSVGGQVFFDMNVANPSGITIGEIGVNTAQVGGFNLDVYTRPGTYVGNTTQAGWTLITSGSGTGAGLNTASMVDVADVLVPSGLQGVALILTGAAHSYTNGNGSNQFYSNADLSLTLGAALNVPWTGTPFTPRVWNGILRYNCLAAPVVYCTAKVNSLGCMPAIDFAGIPSASSGSGFTVSASNERNQKPGLLNYSFAGPSAVPFGGGTLCVAQPISRTPPQNANGTALPVQDCSGTLSIDMNTFATGSLGGTPKPLLLVPGTVVNCQWVGRDPGFAAPNHVSLSDAVEYTIGP